MKHFRLMCLVFWLMGLGAIDIPAFVEESAPSITPNYTYMSSLVVSLRIKNGQARAVRQIFSHSNPRSSITVGLQQRQRKRLVNRFI